MKYAPGTLGSIFGLIAVCLLHGNMYIYTSVFILSFVSGLIASDIVQKQMGVKDPAEIIIDEFSSIFVVFAFIPRDYFTLPLIVSGFVLYRFFDILKIPPINLLEKIKGGTGIMLDDFACGLISGAILSFLIYFGIFVKY